MITVKETTKRKVVDMSYDFIEEFDSESEPEDWDEYSDSDDACMYYRDSNGRWRSHQVYLLTTEFIYCLCKKYLI